MFLEPDFEVGPGPAFHVYLVPQANIRDAAAVTGKMYIDLGQLRAFKGSQRYPVPAGIDLKNYPSVVIWCERFGVLISPADLKPAVETQFELTEGVPIASNGRAKTKCPGRNARGFLSAVPVVDLELVVHANATML